MKKRAISLEYHPTDSRITLWDNDICQTLTERMGTGGGNVPLVLEVDDAEHNRDIKSGGAPR